MIKDHVTLDSFSRSHNFWDFSTGVIANGIETLTCQGLFLVTPSYVDIAYTKTRGVTGILTQIFFILISTEFQTLTAHRNQ